MHSPALSQMPQSTGWLSVMNCIVALRRAFTPSESVSTRMPSVTGMLQAISIQLSPSLPSTSTTQMRQLPAIERSLCQQKYGMKWPFASAACSTVCPGSAWTGVPLMKISGMGGHLDVAAEAQPAVGDRVLELVAILVQDADRRVPGGVAHPADRRAVVRLADRVEPVDVLGNALAVDDPVDDVVHPAHAL